ncbi:MAG: hypothetical protein V1777_04075 [Candidatus Micrarchaeota archaeon]
MNQKGMEMPIQIFITLFVLLAVAILVLTLVQQQFSQSTSELDKQKREQEFQQSVSLAQSTCQNLCKDSCSSAQRKASYCISRVNNLPLNLSKDENNYDETYLAGTGICEDSVYCAQMYDCDCGGSRLTMAACKTLLCDYWKSIGDAASATAKIKQFIKPGSCYTVGSMPNHWYSASPYGGDPLCS